MDDSSDSKLKAKLIAAYEVDTGRSKMGRIRKQFDTILDLQSGGMSLEKILAALNDGLPKTGQLTMQTFNGYLYLLRKERNIGRPLEVPPGVQEPENQPDTPAMPGKLDVGKSGHPKAPAAPDVLDVVGEKLVETNPLRELSGNKKPGEFNPIPSAKIEFD